MLRKRKDGLAMGRDVDVVEFDGGLEMDFKVGLSGF